MSATDAWIHRALLVVLGLVAVNAFGGGTYGILGAQGVPTEWLVGSPFSDYFVPSLILLVVVGGSCVVAAIAVATRAREARASASLAGVVLVGWIAVQVAIIGYVSWLQPAMALAGMTIVALALRLGRFDGAPRPSSLAKQPRTTSSSLAPDSRGFR